MRDNEFKKILGWPGNRVYRQEIDEAAKTLRLWVRRKRGNRRLICSGCGRKFSEAHDYNEREVRDLPWGEYRTTLFLFCPHCELPRPHVYGWEWDSLSGWSNRVSSVSWRCSSCARLRYSFEGGYLCGPRMFRALGNLPRPESWLPYVFTSPEEAAEAGLITLK